MYPASRDTKPTILQREKEGGMLLYFPLNSLPFLKMFAEGHTELQAALGASLEFSAMAEDITIKSRTTKLHLFTAASPARTRSGTASRTALPALPQL